MRELTGFSALILVAVTASLRGNRKQKTGPIFSLAEPNRYLTATTQQPEQEQLYILWQAEQL